jgi:RNA polymerase sigma factor, sigma-70 family
MVDEFKPDEPKNAENFNNLTAQESPMPDKSSSPRDVKEEFNHTDHIPDLYIDDSLSSYLRKIKNFPMLTAEEEYKAAKEWQHHQNPKAKDKLIQSHLRLIAKVAQGYKGYGLNLHDLIAEGHIGMMQALNGFDPEKEIRFSTYALWWIKASINDYVLKNWSLVKMGTTAAQKKLFYNLRQLKQNALSDNHEHLTDQQLHDIAQKLDVPLHEVKEMDKRLSGADYSLNTPRGTGENREWQDWLPDDQGCHADKLAHKDELEKRTAMMHRAFNILKPRELDILKRRRLEEPPRTLEQISFELNLSRERVRQIEMEAFQKLQHTLRSQLSA